MHYIIMKWRQNIVSFLKYISLSIKIALLMLCNDINSREAMKTAKYFGITNKEMRQWIVVDAEIRTRATDEGFSCVRQ